MANYRVLGLMSGTSLDGLDLCLVEFQMNDTSTHFEILKSRTLPYDSGWTQRLQFSELSGPELAQLNVDLGIYFGERAKAFLSGEQVDFIASHGHTMYHSPRDKYSVQIGHGGALAICSGCKVVSDFRSQDVVLGGQGAPLVPIGDRDLFGNYDACLNLGGFANVSMNEGGGRVAWDICPVNFVLNHLANKEGLSFDRNGELARQGKPDAYLLNQMNGLSYYQESGAKSLGAEWVWKEFMPLLNDGTVSNKDKLATVVAHCAVQIAQVIEGKNVLVTGGGAKNEFLIESIRSQSSAEIIVPNVEIVDYKEALIFAYLGLLRVLGRANVLASATGASKDSISGAVYLPL